MAQIFPDCNHGTAYEICGTLLCPTCYHDEVLLKPTKIDIARAEKQNYRIVMVYDETVHREIMKAVRNGKVIE